MDCFGYWSHAGSLLTLLEGPPFFSMQPESKWCDVFLATHRHAATHDLIACFRLTDEAAKVRIRATIAAGGEYGDRKQELVMIGINMQVGGSALRT
jgi:hypothetical protein